MTAAWRRAAHGVGAWGKLVVTVPATYGAVLFAVRAQQ